MTKLTPLPQAPQDSVGTMPLPGTDAHAAIVDALRDFIGRGLELQLRLEAAGESTGADILQRHLSEAAALFDMLSGRPNRRGK